QPVDFARGVKMLQFAFGHVTFTAGRGEGERSEDMPEVKPDSAQTCGLLEEVRQGGRQALERLLTHYRADTHALVDFHLEPHLRASLDPSEIVQEARLEGVRRMDDFLERRPMPFHLWVRKTAYERLLNLRRDHRRRVRRSVDREVPLPDRSSLLLVRPLVN